MHKYSFSWMFLSVIITTVDIHGVLAQLGARLNGIEEAMGSSPISSISNGQGACSGRFLLNQASGVFL